MARPGLLNHRKFLRLARGVGDDALALGSLELLWAAANESGDPYLGQSDDVEAFARWRGAQGALTRALLAAGGDGNLGFIEELPERPGHYQVHDLFDHAPDYVRRRMERELQRQARGTTLSEIRAEAGRRGAAARLATVRQPEATEIQVLTTDEQTSAKGATPAPAPAPKLPSARRKPRGDAGATWLTPIAEAHEKIFGVGSFSPLAGRFAASWKQLVDAHGAEKCGRVWAFSQRDEGERKFLTPEKVAGRFADFDPDAPAFPNGVAA